jgi:hypothetical protein
MPGCRSKSLTARCRAEQVFVDLRTEGIFECWRNLGDDLPSSVTAYGQNLMTADRRAGVVGTRSTQW